MRPFTAPNFTQTPNDLVDHLLPHLSESELKVLLVIMRKTFGWHKKRDRISISQLSEVTGMLRETVIKATRSLQIKGLIIKEVIGPKGNQETYYELVVNEDSNNSYQSVKPTPLVGSTILGSTDSQKKALSTKETTTKEKDAVVTSHKNIYPCLEAIEIPGVTIDVKVDLTHKYDEQTVKDAIEKTEANKANISSYVGYLINACKKGLKPEKKKDIARENKLYALKYDGMRNEKARIEVLNKSVEIDTGNPYTLFSESYESKVFMEKFKNALRKYDFHIWEAD